MLGINKAILIGNLGNDPECKRLSDRMVVRFTLATSSRFKDRNGEPQERTQWHHIVIWNQPLAESCEKFLHKGARVYIEGEIETRNWDDNGAKRYMTEIVIKQFSGKLIFLDLNQNRSETNSARNENERRSMQRSEEQKNSSTSIDDDEIPF